MGVAMLAVGSTVAADQWATGEFGEDEEEIEQFDVDDEEEVDVDD